MVQLGVDPDWCGIGVNVFFAMARLTLPVGSNLFVLPR